MFGSDIRQHPHLFDCRTLSNLQECLPEISTCLERKLHGWCEPTWRADEASKADAAKKTRSAHLLYVYFVFTSLQLLNAVVLLLGVSCSSGTPPVPGQPLPRLSVHRRIHSSADNVVRGVECSIKTLAGEWEPPHPHLDGVLCAGCVHSNQTPPFAFRSQTIYSMWAAASRGERLSSLRCEREGRHESHVTELLAPEVVVSYCWTAGSTP
eukprot:3620798-Rhodomonas_salina.2